MGMFDWVNFEYSCPRCKKVVTGFQTKDTDCTLATVEPEKLDNFYSSCESCGAWIEFTRKHNRTKSWLKDFDVKCSKN